MVDHPPEVALRWFLGVPRGVASYKLNYLQRKVPERTGQGPGPSPSLCCQEVAGQPGSWAAWPGEAFGPEQWPQPACLSVDMMVHVQQLSLGSLSVKKQEPSKPEVCGAADPSPWQLFMKPEAPTSLFLAIPSLRWRGASRFFTSTCAQLSTHPLRQSMQQALQPVGSPVLEIFHECPRPLF